MSEVLTDGDCVSCGRFRPLKANGSCFGCWVGVGSSDGMKVNWVGGGSYGRDSFHNYTVKERQDEQKRGFDPQREYRPKNRVYAGP